MTASLMAWPDDGSADHHPARDFDGFYHQTVAAVFARAVTAARGDREVAKDAVQEAFAALWKCWTSRQELSLRDNRRYILVVVFNKVMDHYRRVVRLKECELDDDLEPFTADPADFVDELATDDAVRRFLYGLPPRQLAVAQLCFLEGFTYQEAAEILHVSGSTVRNHIKRVRDAANELRARHESVEGA